MSANVYTDIISIGLKVDLDQALEIQRVIDSYFDFRYGSATQSEIIKTARQALEFMKTPLFDEVNV